MALPSRKFNKSTMKRYTAKKPLAQSIKRDTFNALGKRNALAASIKGDTFNALGRAKASTPAQPVAAGSAPPVLNAGIGSSPTGQYIPQAPASNEFIGGSNGFDAGSAGGPATSGPSRSIEERARELLGIELDPKRDAIKRALEAARLGFSMEENTQKKFGEGMDAKLQEIYNALRGDLEQGQKAREGHYNAGMAESGNIMNRALGSVQGAGAQNTGQLMQEAGNLGLEAGLRDPISRSQAQSADLERLLRTSGANTQSALSAEKTNQLNYGQGGIDLSRKELASERSGTASKVLAALQDLGLERATTERDTAGQLADIESTRGAKLRQLIEEMTADEAAAASNAEKEAFARQLQLMAAGLDRDKLGATLRGQDMDYSLGTARLGMEQQKHALETQAAQTTDPLKRTKLEAEIKKLNADTANTLAKAGTTAATKYVRGPGGVNAWAKDKKLGPKFIDYVSQIGTEAIKRANSRVPVGRGKGYTDPYQVALQIANQTKGKYGQLGRPYNKKLAREALAIWFGQHA